ncbi:uncharacterized protein LOC104905669 [Beta vulgaris subsp. vulgaris]|uniref:uncharacterized protein LOC104905669 n=1 Tax=Beta vulgaris subsp. vulgaris TaxID=3555 RepID=UPI00053F7B3C|nr:uncharacterized protein LOC104905669 [Beta vulgaris subsp. vulgaris]
MNGNSNGMRSIKRAFDQIKQDLASPLVLIPLRRNGKPLRLYLSAYEDSISRLLTQENEKGHEQTIFYPSRILHHAEKRYNMPEKWCLCLYDASAKLIQYFMAFTVEVPSDSIEIAFPKKETSASDHKNSKSLGSVY